MNIYLLECMDGASYDEAAGFVVIAPDVAGARELASKDPGDEGAATWLAPGLASCTLIGAASTSLDAHVVLRDFNAG